jgi:hypothetical protein
VSWLSDKKYMNVGWVLLLFLGLGGALPEQMKPLMTLPVFGIKVQVIAGIVSVILAIYYLMGNEEND